MYYFQVVPFMWVLMSNKTEETYEALWKAMLQINPECHPEIVMADFEQATRTSL